MGSRDTHKKQRQRLKKRLREVGVPEDQVERLIRQKQQEQLLERQIAQAGASPESIRYREMLEDQTYARLCPDDSKFRPRKADPLLVGAGRATGIAAKVAKRGKTVTKWEHDGKPE